MDSLLVNKSQFKQIDDYKKNIVFGYVRIAQQYLSNKLICMIPKHIILIILAFYAYFSDEFDNKLCDKNLQILNNNKVIKGGGEWAWNTCYGKEIIESKNDGKYIWKIKALTNPNMTYIGIDNSVAKFVNDRFSRSKIKAMYAYRVNGKLRSWNEDIKYDLPKFTKKGDILTMTLKFGNNTGILTIKVNDGKEYMVENITRDNTLNYRFAVAIYGKNHSYQILD